MDFLIIVLCFAFVIFLHELEKRNFKFRERARDLTHFYYARRFLRRRRTLFLLILAVCFLIGCSKPRAEGWTLFYTDGSERMYYHSDIIKPYRGLIQVWVKNDSAAYFLIELREDQKARTLERVMGGDRFKIKGEYETIVPDSLHYVLFKRIFNERR